MNFFNSRLTLSVAVLSLAALCGCSVEAGVSAGPNVEVPDNGTLTVLSSIEGSTDPAECDFVGATDLELAIYEGDRQVTVVTSDCYDFGISVSLPDGIYNADATLLDNGVAASTTLTLDEIRVISGTDIQIDIDFPASSILP